MGQLAKLSEITRRRAELASEYFDVAKQTGLEAIGVELPPRPPAIDATGAITNWHMFQVMLPVGRLIGGRAAVMQSMRDAGIGTGVHYPAIHRFSYYRSLGWREGMLPHAEGAGRSLLTLPLFPSMRSGDVERVCESLVESCKQKLG